MIIFSTLLLSFIIIITILYFYTFHQVQKLPFNSPSNFLRSNKTNPGIQTVICFGDSITHGQVSHNYVNILSEKMSKEGLEFINAGVNGNLVYNLIQRLDTIIDCNPDFITILIGTNDANSTLSEKNSARYIKNMALPEKPDKELFEKNYIYLIKELKKRTNAKIALLSLPPVGEDKNHISFQRTKEYSKIIHDISLEQNVDYLPLYERIDEYLGLDHHPALSYDEGYRWVMIKGFFLHFLFGYSFDKIASKNGFLIVTDFLHLNSYGANLIADLIQKWITKKDII